METTDDEVALPMWQTIVDAMMLCREIEAVCPQYGCHVALTGGVLYKQLPRKDLDILFYRIRQADGINMDGLWSALRQIGIIRLRGHGWCHKCDYKGLSIDCFFPEEQWSAEETEQYERTRRR